MTRRHFMAGLAGAVLAPLANARAQQSGRLPRIGILTTSIPSESRAAQAFITELRRLGWVDGQSVSIEWKVTAGQIERFDALARELVAKGTDVIVAPNPNAVVAARRATASVPIVMVNTPDPVQLGLVAGLARPGGNITGTSSLSADVSAKQAELMKELVPGMTRLTVMSVATNPWHPHAVAAIASSARPLGIEHAVITAQDARDFESAFAQTARGDGGGILVLADPVTFFHRASLAELGVRYRIASGYGLREYAEAGGLMSYWADHVVLFRRTAAYVDKLLRGERAESMPIEQPTKYELVINLRTAKAIGLEIPSGVLVRADEVIE
jgi:putative ABC transport system substrate-binding protein